MKSNAYEELIAKLADGEKIEKIIFGPWSWGTAPSHPEDKWELGYGEPDPPPVPFDLRGKLLDIDVARPLMSKWSFDGGYGAPDCYAIFAWSNLRVFWVTQYDGSTSLDSAPRNPETCMPGMPGG